MVNNTSVSAIWFGSILKRSCESDDQVSQFARLERAFSLFSMSRKRRAQSIGPDGVFQADTFLREQNPREDRLLLSCGSKRFERPARD